LLALTAGLLPLGVAARAQNTPPPPHPAPPPGPAPTDSAPVGGAPLAKMQVGYQDVPEGGKVCAQCVYFMFEPAQGSGPSSRCQLVAGPISPAGWCEIWAPKA